MLGSPTTVDANQWENIRSVVSGKIVNGWHESDWVLGHGYLALIIILIEILGMF